MAEQGDRPAAAGLGLDQQSSGDVFELSSRPS